MTYILWIILVIHIILIFGLTGRLVFAYNQKTSPSGFESGSVMENLINKIKITRPGRLIYRHNVVVYDQSKYDDAIAWCKKHKITMCCKLNPFGRTIECWDRMNKVPRAKQNGPKYVKIIDDYVMSNDWNHVYSFIRAKDAMRFKLVWS